MSILAISARAEVCSFFVTIPKWTCEAAIVVCYDAPREWHFPYHSLAVPAASERTKHCTIVA